MSLSHLRVVISVIVLLAYLITIIVLAAGTSLRWIGIRDAVEVGRAIIPLFSGYVAAVIGFYFAERPARAANARRPKTPPVPKPIARSLILAVGIVCASVPISVLMNCFNLGPIADPKLLLNVIVGEQTIIAGLVGVLVSAMLSRKDDGLT
jgi:hypothetical protein